MNWKNVVFTASTKEGLLKAKEQAAAWCAERPLAIGVAEMALGAALITFGVKSGAIDMGRDLVASVLSPEQNLAFIGGGTGTAAGAALGLLGNIGVVGAGLSLSIPAFALAGSGALLLGLGGYGSGKLVEEFFGGVPTLGESIGPACLLAVGVALMVDGSRRVLSDKGVQAGLAKFQDWTLELTGVSADQLLTSASSLGQYIKGEATNFVIQHVRDPRQLGMSSALVGLGAWGGAAAAASSVTVLGSTTLGSLALAAGLASPPLWPVFAGGALGAAGSYAVSRVGRARAIRTLIIGPPMV